MKNSLVRSVASLTAIVFSLASLTACAPKTNVEPPASQLAAAALATQARIASSGAIARASAHGPIEFTEVYDASHANARFVNDAVLLGANQDFKEISRRAVGEMGAFGAIRQIATAKPGGTFEYASESLKVLANKVVQTKNGFVQTLKVKDLLGGLGTFTAQLKYEVGEGLITNVEVDHALFDESNPEEVCFYYPANCVQQVSLNFSVKAVHSLMAAAFNKYEVAQNLAEGTNKQYFEAIMHKMDSTFDFYDSWTTVNADASAGSVFNAKSKRGVAFNSYDAPAPIDGTADLSGIHGPDNGFVSGLFFDPTDGGSTYFYGPISFDAATQTFEIRDNQNTLMAQLTFVGDKLVSYVDNTIGANGKFTLSAKVDTELLKSKLAD
jgi:hypothetical protein